MLVPLITQLLKPEVYQSDPLGMSETRVRAATLLSKVFLHYLVLLSGTNDLLDLWLKIITIMDRLMNSGQGDNLVRRGFPPSPIPILPYPTSPSSYSSSLTFYEVPLGRLADDHVGGGSI